MVNGAERGHVRVAGLPDPEDDLRRGCHQAIGSSTSTTPIGHLVPQQPLRAHRRPGRRLRRDADDDLRRLQPAVELPAEQPVDDAASGRRGRRRRPRCCRSAARTTTRSPTGSPGAVDRMTMPTLERVASPTPVARARHARRAAVVAAARCSPAAAAAAQPARQPGDVENPTVDRRASARRSPISRSASTRSSSRSCRSR